MVHQWCLWKLWKMKLKFLLESVLLDFVSGGYEQLLALPVPLIRKLSSLEKKLKNKVVYSNAENILPDSGLAVWIMTAVSENLCNKTLKLNDETHCLSMSSRTTPEKRYLIWAADRFLSPSNATRFRHKDLELGRKIVVMFSSECLIEAQVHVGMLPPSGI